jgi:hypothetical protein
MKQESEDEFEVYDVPVSPFLSRQRSNRYGSVPGLDDEELASPEELERQVFIEEWWPVLRLPVRHRKSAIQPHIDEYFGVDWGAFATMDFARSMPEFDKTRYKADRLEEELRDVIIMMETLSGRLPKARFAVLRYVERGIIDLGHIESLDMYELARLYLRALRQKAEIQRLRKASWRRLRRELAEVVE